MKITTVSYQRTYNLGSYNSEKIGLEADIEEGEDIQFVVCNLKHECDQIHQKNNPHLHQEQETTIPQYNVIAPQQKIIIEHMPENTTKLTEHQLITQEIPLCKTTKQLEEWALLAKKYPETKELYNNRLNELSK